MRIENGSVIFEDWDFDFVRRFGPVAAADMALKHKKALPKLPFLYDTYQLVNFLPCGDGKTFFRMLRYIDREYRTVNIKKKNGGGRTLHTPSPRLKRMQKRILRDILKRLLVSEYATAYKKGAQIYANAAPHVGKQYILKLDITNFFGSISAGQVYSAAFNSGYFSKQVGVMLTKLCCRDGVLPQGAPTSPALSNLVMKNFDDNIGAWCEKRGIAYTRYCDDMTFSSGLPLYHVYEKAKAMLGEMGLKLNEKKTRFVSNAARQSVTGLTVNEKVAVSRAYKRELRQQVYYYFKYGYDFRQWNREAYTPEKYLRYLQGRVNFVLQIEPNNKWFREASAKLSAFQKMKTVGKRVF